MWSTSRQRSWIAPGFDGLFICASLFALRGFYPFAFQVLGWFPHLWQRQDTSIDPSPSLNSPAGRENVAQPLWLGGESQLVPSLEFHSWCPGGFPRWLRGSGQVGVCLQPALDKPLLLHVPPNPRWVSCGSGSVILVFFSSSPLPPPPHV